MKREFSSYESLVFDCDGVILDSNIIKTQAFYEVCLPYGRKSAKALVDYHLTKGGISRYKKFSYFLEEILLLPPDANELKSLLDSYSQKVSLKLVAAPVAEGLEKLRSLSGAKWAVASGSDQIELREVLRAIGIDKYFDGGIHGSPATKDEILQREIKNKNLQTPSILLGDSKYDHEAATKAGIDFLFVSDWSEFKEWEQYTAELAINTIPSINTLIKYY